MITALEVYEAFYDIANDRNSLIADFNGNEVEAIKAYADGAFDVLLTDEAAKAIANASEKFRAYDGYDLSQKYWEFVKQPLEEISV